MLQLQAAALLVGVVGHGHLRLQPDRQLRAGDTQETRNNPENQQNDTTRHLTSVSLDSIGHKTVVRILGRGVEGWEGGAYPCCLGV